MPRRSQSKGRETNKSNSQNDRALQYFEQILKENGTFKCNVENCYKILNGKKCSNLVAHIRCSHLKIYERFIAPTKDKSYYELKRLKFVQNCAEIIAINGRPFTALQDSGFRKIVEKDLEELREHNCGFNLDDEHFIELKDYIQEVASKIKNKIKADTRAKFVSLMVDSARKNDKSFLGINIQYAVDGRVELRLLGMVQLKQAHTAQYIKEVIVTCLLLYDIGVDQIVSITTDNGANMLAMIDLFNKADDNTDAVNNADDDDQEHINNDSNINADESVESASVSTIIII